MTSFGREAKHLKCKYCVMFRSSRPEVFCKKGVLDISQNSQENIYARISFLIKLQASVCNFIKKETLAQVFSCEFCEVSKNTFSYRTPPVASSGCFKTRFKTFHIFQIYLHTDQSAVKAHSWKK